MGSPATREERVETLIFLTPGPPAGEVELVLAGEPAHGVEHAQDLFDRLALGLGGDGVGEELPPFAVGPEDRFEQLGALGAGEVLPGHHLADQKDVRIHAKKPPLCIRVIDGVRVFQI
jgi:hypothetical protein